MEPVISIPKHWRYPRYTFGQRSEHGEIIGMKYYAPDTYLASQYGEGWRYIMLPHRNMEEEIHHLEARVHSLTPDQLNEQLQAEIDYYSRQLGHIKSLLIAIPANVAATGSNADLSETHKANLSPLNVPIGALVPVFEAIAYRDSLKFKQLSEELTSIYGASTWCDNLARCIMLLDPGSRQWYEEMIKQKILDQRESEKA